MIGLQEKMMEVIEEKKAQLTQLEKEEKELYRTVDIIHKRRVIAMVNHDISLLYDLLENPKK